MTEHPVPIVEGEEGALEGTGEEGEENVEVEVSPPTRKIVLETNKEPFKPPECIKHVRELPESTRSNTDRELLINEYAENFRRQYVFLYRDRKPLFLTPLNEAGVEKMVVCTVHPTLLPYRELWNYDGAAAFVSSYLSFQQLEPPTELPTQLYSSMMTLRLHKGNCFDYSQLLCSLLIGAGYDAYIVCGYATKETCLMDESREICPLLKTQQVKCEESRAKEVKKYSVKPPKDLRSKYIMEMEARKVKAEEEAKRKLLREEQARLLKESEACHDSELNGHESGVSKASSLKHNTPNSAKKKREAEKPPPDSLYGMRVHAWVLVLHGKREVPENFFIESLTGQTYPTNHSSYLGIESLWNHKNYWVCMQDCSNGCKDLIFDLGDCSKWEFMFPHTDQPQLEVPEDGVDELRDEDEEQILDDRIIELPPSWAPEIKISQKDYELRCPEGKKTLFYKRAKLEIFAPYVCRDGLVKRLTNYEDTEMNQPLSVKEWFSNRHDRLAERYHDKVTTQVTESFLPGRTQAIKEHHYLAPTQGVPETDRTQVFYGDVRVDGLLKRTESSTMLVEDFKGREDRLYFRKAIFDKRQKSFGPSDAKSLRPIAMMVEKYGRDNLKSADEDLAEVVYHLAEDKILVTYHKDDNRIAPSYREFLKPNQSDDKSTGPILAEDMVTSFQVDHTMPPPKQLYIYQMFLGLLDSEQVCVGNIRASEDEVMAFLKDRMEEESSPKLEVSHYDTERNEEIKKQRRILEQQENAEKKRREEMELDYLAPFLAQIGNPESLNRMEAFKLKEDCLADLKARLIDKANLIQARFEKETLELQKKQQWYQSNQITMTQENEEDYLNYCSDAMFRIHILEQRLNRHKAQAPQKYTELEGKLKNDSRLMTFIK